MNIPKILGRAEMIDAAASLRELAEPWAGGEKVKVAIQRAAKRANLSYWRAFDIWYGKARRIEQFEHDAIAEALDQKRREAARNELHELRSRLERFESLLAQIDPDFHRNTIAQTRQQIRALGGARRAPDSAVD